MAPPMACVDEIMAHHFPLSASVNMSATSTYESPTIPPLPIPCIDRPPSSIEKLLESAPIKLPTRKRAMDTVKIILLP